MGLANIPDDWMGDYIDYVVRWPLSEQWEAILRGQLTGPHFIEFWDLFSGDPTEAIESMPETFDTNLHLEEGAMLPAGMMFDYAGGTIPDGWLLCDGSTISRVTYARLFAAIGTLYGPGNGSTTFEIPDTRQRVRVALHEGETTFGELGETGGTQTVSLATANLPSHTHLQDPHDHTQEIHTHSITQRFRTATVTANSNEPEAGEATVGTFAGNPTGPATPNINPTSAVNHNTGSDTPHNNLQPYFVSMGLIKT